MRPARAVQLRRCGGVAQLPAAVALRMTDSSVAPCCCGTSSMRTDLDYLPPHATAQSPQSSPCGWPYTQGNSVLAFRLSKDYQWSAHDTYNAPSSAHMFDTVSHIFLGDKAARANELLPKTPRRLARLGCGQHRQLSMVLQQSTDFLTFLKSVSHIFHTRELFVSCRPAAPAWLLSPSLLQLCI